MKACVIQPPYYTDYSRSDECFRWEMDALDQCGEELDLIVLPELSDVPCFASNSGEYVESLCKYNESILKKAAATAKRCKAVVFINAFSREEAGLRNTTHAFNTRGELVGRYFKQHLTPGEMQIEERDTAYSLEFSEPTILEIDGIRYGFLTCYDFYFYEAFPNIAKQRPDIIIGCSHQRVDRHDALELMSRFCAYNTNAWIVRAAVSMGEDSPLGGCSCIVSPDGTVLANLKSRIGTATVEIDPHQKYYKPAGFGNPETAHWEYIEKGRRPWKYRPAGSAIVKPDSIMPYPRVCAHRGFNAVAPENSMPAFGAAIAMGAEEIEFDLFPTKDGEIVSIHDNMLDRVSDGTGVVYEQTLEELRRYDFGIKSGDAFKGMRILRFEDILKKFACHVIMNVHIKVIDTTWPDTTALKKIIALIRKYDCEKYCYFMAPDWVLEQTYQMAPEIGRCCSASGDPWGIVDRAIKIGAQKVQLFKPYFNQEMIDKAHAHGIRCNVFWADDPEETQEFLDMGVDTILTNEYNLIAQVVAKNTAGK